MNRPTTSSLLAFGAAGALIAAATLSVSARCPLAVPAPHAALPAISAPTQTIVLAGGSFWGVQGVFEHVEGVTQAVAGYAGGATANPRYEDVSQGRTGHAEAVEVTFDPQRISLGDVLRIYFSIAHDPTEVDRQGADFGPQYRSEIFAADAAAAAFAKSYIAELVAAKAFARPIATKVEPLAAFYPAEAYHQHYAARRPGDIYDSLNEAPKVAALKAAFPGLYRESGTQQMAAQ